MNGDRGEAPWEVDTGGDPAGRGYVYEPDDDESVSEGVVMAVSAVADRRPTDLTPLYHTLDTDALEKLAGRSGRGPAPTAVRLTFEYEGYTVTVDEDHRIRVGD